MRAHDFSLRQLQYALSVARAKGFRAAADACHVSQPALSSQIAALEEALGVRLFERDRRRVVLTPAGAEVLARAQGLLRDADELRDAAARLRDPRSGTLRIGVIPTIGPYVLPDLAAPLAERFPRMRILWREEKTAVLLAALERGEIDAALIALEEKIEHVEREEIAKDTFVLAAPPKHRLVRGRSVRQEQLAGASVLLLEDGHCFREQVLALCEQTRAQEGSFRATSLSTLVQMVTRGTAVTLLPSIAVPLENRRGQLTIRRFARPVPARTIGLIWRPQSPLRATLRQIAAALRQSWPAPT